MDNDGVGQEIRYADVVVNRELSFVGFTPDQFLEMCVMSGCDYLPSLPGVGIKRAHGLIRRFRTHDKALRNLRFEGTPVPRRYEEGFRDALLTFKHQWVFCPSRREMVHLSDGPGSDGAPPPMCPEDVDRLVGPRHPPEIARGVADGELHPMHLRPYEALRTSGNAAGSGGIPGAGSRLAPRGDAKRTRADAAAPNHAFRRGEARGVAASTTRERQRRARRVDGTRRVDVRRVRSFRGGCLRLDGCLCRESTPRAANAAAGGAWGGSRDCPTAAQVALADAAARARHGREADVLFALRKSPAEAASGLKSPSGRRRNRARRGNRGER